MEDHRDAYFFWKELGLGNLTCVHVDAHLDVCDRRVPGYSGVRPEINCGNYLLPAMNEGVVDKLVWVVPPHLKGESSLLEWAREELQVWVRLSVQEYNSLKCVGSVVEGELLGKPFLVCESDSVPRFDDPVLLDIDADYYLDPDDGVWQSPQNLQRHLSHLSPVALTVAYSVQGGFTPIHRRYLGDLTVCCFTEPELAESYQAALTTDCPLPENSPPWLQASYLLKAGLQLDSPEYEEATKLNNKYRADLVDLAWWRLSRKDYHKAELWIEKLEDGLERDYLRGLSRLYQQHFEKAAHHWKQILERPDLEASTRRHLLELQARALLGAGCFEESVNACSQALKLDRRAGDLWSLLANAHYKMGRLEEAARAYRKSVSCFKDKLDGVWALLDLAQTYLDLGQIEPALTQCRRITKGDAPPLLKIQAEMIAMKARMA